MQTRKNRIVLALALMGLSLPSFGVERDYVEGAVLTRGQELEVIELARECGVENVSRISTCNMLPTPFRGITVHGVERVEGREVSSRVLNVSYLKWQAPEAGSQKGQVRRGDFWAGKSRLMKKSILRTGGEEYRVGSLGGMTAEECETVLGLLLDGEYEPGPAVNGKVLSQVDWSRPITFSRRGGSISAGFLHRARGSGFFDLQFRLAGKKLVIERVLQAVP